MIVFLISLPPSSAITLTTTAPPSAAARGAAKGESARIARARATSDAVNGEVLLFIGTILCLQAEESGLRVCVSPHSLAPLGKFHSTARRELSLGLCIPERKPAPL